VLTPEQLRARCAAIQAELQRETGGRLDLRAYRARLEEEGLLEAAVALTRPSAPGQVERDWAALQGRAGPRPQPSPNGGNGDHV